MVDNPASRSETINLFVSFLIQKALQLNRNIDVFARGSPSPVAPLKLTPKMIAHCYSYLVALKVIRDLIGVEIMLRIEMRLAR